MLRLALVEDHPKLRNRLIERLRFFSDVALVFSAENGADCLQKMEGLTADEWPHVILMDIEMPVMNGLEATARVKTDYPGIEILMLTVFEDEDKIFAAIQSGASGYLLKDEPAETIVQAAHDLRSGGAPMTPVVARKLLGYVRSSEESNAEAETAFNLTPREREVLALLVSDETEAQIAERLFVSPHTVRSHVKNVYAKLHVHSRAQAVRFAYEKGIVR